MTRIFDIDGNELQEEDIDLEKGYLTPDRKFIEHHDAIEGKEREFHYSVSAFYFEDGSSYKPESEDDPRIIIQDAKKGLFSYAPAEGEDKKLRGIDLREIEDSAAVPAQEAWDEYEDIQVYREYTEEEIEQKKQEEKSKADREELLASGLSRIIELEERSNNSEQNIQDISAQVESTNNNVDSLSENLTYEVENINSNLSNQQENVSQLSISLQDTNTTVEDLILTMADLLGVEE